MTKKGFAHGARECSVRYAPVANRGRKRGMGKQCHGGRNACGVLKGFVFFFLLLSDVNGLDG